MPQQDVELNEIALGGSSSQSESSSSSSSSSSNGGSGDSGKKKHSKLCLILCIVIPVVVVVVVVVVLVVVLTGKPKSATCTKTDGVMTCTGGKLTKDSFTGKDSGFDPATDTLMDIGTFDGEIDPEAFDDFVALRAFDVDLKNTKYTANGGSLITRAGRELVRVPQKIVISSGVTIDCSETQPTTGTNAEVNTNRRRITPMAATDSQIEVTNVSVIRKHAFYGVAKAKITLPLDAAITVENGAFGISTSTLELSSSPEEDVLDKVAGRDKVKFMSDVRISMASGWNTAAAAQDTTPTTTAGKFVPASMASKVSGLLSLTNLGTGANAPAVIKKNQTDTDMKYITKVTKVDLHYITDSDDIQIGDSIAISTKDVSATTYSLQDFGNIVPKELVPVHASALADITFTYPVEGTVKDLENAKYLEHAKKDSADAVIKNVVFLRFLKEGTYVFRVDKDGYRQEYRANVTGTARADATGMAKGYSFPSEAFGTLHGQKATFAVVDISASTGKDPTLEDKEGSPVTTDPNPTATTTVSFGTDDNYYVSAFASAAGLDKDKSSYTMTNDDLGSGAVTFNVVEGVDPLTASA